MDASIASISACKASKASPTFIGVVDASMNSSSVFIIFAFIVIKPLIVADPPESKPVNDILEYMFILI